MGMMQSRALSTSLSLELRSPGLPMERRDMLSTLKRNRPRMKSKQETNGLGCVKNWFRTHPHARPRSMDPLLMAPERSAETRNARRSFSGFQLVDRDPEVASRAALICWWIFGPFATLLPFHFPTFIFLSFFLSFFFGCFYIN